MDILTVGVVTMPFLFEGKQRMERARIGYKNMYDVVDSIVTIQNDKLLSIVSKNTPMRDAFKIADDVLRQGIQGITDLIAKPAMINLDFADVQKVMVEHGVAHMGIGIGHGENKTIEAAKLAIQSPLLETNIEGARGILFNITGDASMSLAEISEAAELIREAADENANIFFGADIDETLEDEARITVIATGFGERIERPAPMAPVQAPIKPITSSAPTSEITWNRGEEWKKPEESKRKMDVLQMPEDEELDLPFFLKDRRKPRE